MRHTHAGVTRSAVEGRSAPSGREPRAAAVGFPPRLFAIFFRGLTARQRQVEWSRPLLSRCQCCRGARARRGCPRTPLPAGPVAPSPPAPLEFARARPPLSPQAARTMSSKVKGERGGRDLEPRQPLPNLERSVLSPLPRPTPWASLSSACASTRPVVDPSLRSAGGTAPRGGLPTRCGRRCRIPKACRGLPLCKLQGC